MERDFLGIHGKDSKEENRGSRQDSAFFGGSPLQWPFSNDLASMQQFLTFKRPHEDAGKIVQFDKHPSSGFHPISTGDAFEATRKPSPVLVQQRSFNLERQGVHFAMQSQSTDSLGATKHPSSDKQLSFPVVPAHSIPMMTSSPFFHVHGAPNVPNFMVSTSKQQLSAGGIPVNVHSLGANVGSYATRNAANSLPMTSQLTIFYAGSVNVYDDIPLDKAQAIMFLASAGSRLNSNVLNQRPETPLLAPKKALGPDGVGTNLNQIRTPTPHVTPSSSGLSSPISITSLKDTLSASSSMKVSTDMMPSKASVQTAPTNNNQNEPSKTVSAPLMSPSNVTVMARAVPQARRASLARFLEKRKERVMDTMPYSCTKKSPEEANGPEKANLPNKPSSADIALSSNMEHTWHLRQPKSGIVESGESPSTKLEI